MPYKFEFNDQVNNRSFTCDLQCGQCEATAKNQQRCRKRTCIGVPFCWVHLLGESHLRIQASTIEGAGKGLFAMKRRAEENEIIFKPRETIIPYVGELISKDDSTERYGDRTAAYGVERNQNQDIDAACKRGVGALANHRPTRYTNARLASSPVHGIIVVATKRIRNNQEIFINYGRHYIFNEQGVTNRTVNRR